MLQVFRLQMLDNAAQLAVRDAVCVDMWVTCDYAGHMSRMIQVRNVPDAVHRTLKVRAAMAGMSLSDYLLVEIRRVCERPTLEELCERLHRREPVKVSLSAARAVRAEREAH